MSRENVEIVRRGFEAFARGDIEAVLDSFDPEVEWSPAIAPILGVDTVRGKDALRRFLTQDLFDGFDDFRAEPLSFEDHGDKVLIPTRYRGRGQASGLEIDQTWVAVYTVRGGKVTGQRDYETRSEALEAEGLEE
ncbi:MAG: nuclear transport factor 2 family protein [Thermoleophilaceae bacterium]